MECILYVKDMEMLLEPRIEISVWALKPVSTGFAKNQSNWSKFKFQNLGGNLKTE
jgi:hypothetical protein